MMTVVVDADPGDLQVGMPLEVTFRPLDDDTTAPYFRPITGEDT
jgi:uncharacterized OB-fold protein